MFVQVVSKWAAPDVFAYVLLYYLFRELNRPPLLEALAILDVGFTCYALFCVSSVVCTLNVSLPSVPGEHIISRHRSPWMIRYVANQNLAVPVIVLAWLGLGALAVGMTAPCFAIQANSNVLMEPQGPLPSNVSMDLPFGVKVAVPLKPLLDKVDMGRFVNADVSLYRCMLALLRWFWHSGETNLILALVLVAVFALLFTAMDFIALVFAAHNLSTRTAKGSEQEIYFRSQGPPMAVAYILKHIAMLDVCLMGVFVVCLAGSIYKKQGVELSMQWGMVPLLIAEAIHYFLYYSVAGAAEFLAASQSIEDAKQ